MPHNRGMDATDVTVPAEGPRDGRTLRGSSLIPAVLVALVTVVVFGRVMNQPFGPFDDEPNLLRNPYLNPPTFTEDRVLWLWTHPHMHMWLPVSYTVWGAIAAIDYRADSPAPGPNDDPTISPRMAARPFHEANVLAHVAAALLAFAVLRKLIGQPWPAAAGALLFAVHPLQTESVAWVAGLRDVLSGAFSLGAIWVYLVATDEKVPARRGRGVALHALALLLYALALLSKPSVMVLPALLVAIDLVIRRRSVAAVARSVWPYVLIAIPVAVIARLVHPAVNVATLPLYHRPALAGASVAFYLGKLVWPADLAFDYAWRATEIPPALLYGLAVIPLALLGMAVVFRRQMPALLAGLCVFILGLAPVLGLTPFAYQFHTTVADHYVYLAMLGPALIAAALLSRARIPRGAAIAAAGVVLAALAVRSYIQLGYWDSPRGLLEHTIAVSPRSSLAHNQLGQWNRYRRDLAGAAAEFAVATEANPSETKAPVNLVVTLAEMGKSDEAVKAVGDAVARMGNDDAESVRLMSGALYNAALEAYNQAVARRDVAELRRARRAVVESIRLRGDGNSARLLEQLDRMLTPGAREEKGRP